MTGTAVATKQDGGWRDQLRKMDQEFAVALPAHIQVDRFRRAAETAVMINPTLRECDRASLFQALMRCAETGLMPDGKHAALVPFKSKVQFQPMVFGLLSLMRNSDEVKDITVDVIHEDDEYDVERGDNPHIYHKPNLAAEGDIIAAYAILTTKDGGRYFELMNRKALDKVRNCSQSWRFAESGPTNRGGGKKDSVWHNWEEEMSIKSAVKRLSKRAPTSNDRLIRAIDYDNMDYSPELANTPVKQQRSQSQIASARLRGEPIPDDDATAPESPEDEQSAAVDVDAEETQGGDAGEDTADEDGKEDAPDQDSSNLTDEPAFVSETDAMHDIERHCKDCDTSGPADLKERYEGWAGLVQVSFKKPDDVLAAGKTLVKNRLHEIQQMNEGDKA